MFFESTLQSDCVWLNGRSEALLTKDIQKNVQKRSGKSPHSMMQGTRNMNSV